jgi:hypothetical protein
MGGLSVKQLQVLLGVVVVAVIALVLIVALGG